MKTDVKKITSLAMLCAMAYVLMFVSKIIPAVQGFLQYDAKDIAITIGGFVFGPLCALIISFVVAFLEFLTVSSTGPIGLLMNFISTATFACIASFVYRKTKTLGGAFLSLGLATIALTAVMLLWNYYITPLYMEVPGSVIKTMLPTVFLPFNLVKGIINSGFILLSYRPIVIALQKTGLVGKNHSDKPKKIFTPALVTGIVIILIFIPVILRMANVI